MSQDRKHCDQFTYLTQLRGAAGTKASSSTKTAATKNAKRLKRKQVVV